MMTYQQLVAEMEKLPLPEQLSLLQVLAGMIGQQARGRKTAVGNGAESLGRVRGILKPVGQPMPSDEELEADYSAYLLEKYA